MTSATSARASRRSRRTARASRSARCRRYEDGDLTLFESGAIVLHIAETLRRAAARRPGGARARDRMDVRRAQFGRAGDHGPVVRDLFEADKPWSEMRRPAVEERIHGRLKDLSARLGDKPWLDGDTFTAGDLLMVSVLRILIDQGFVEAYDNLAAYMHRGIARPAFQGRSPTRWPASPASRPNGTPPGPKSRNKERRHELFPGLRDPGARGQEAGLSRHGEEGRADLRRISARRAPSNAGARTCPTASAPTCKPRGRGRSRARRSSFPGSGGPTRRPATRPPKRCMADERMQPDGDMPFDGKRMIYAGFEAACSTAATAAGSAISTAIVGAGRRTTSARRSSTMPHASTACFMEKGALRVVDGWGVGRARRQGHRLQARGRRRRTARRSSSAGSNGPTRRRATPAWAR